MAKIRIITPLHSLSDAVSGSTLMELKPLEKLGITFDEVCLKSGPASIETHFDEVLCAPYTVAAAIAAEKDGIDAVIINCMGDPGLYAAREVVSMPVFGPCETSLHVAAMMGHRFSVVSVVESVRPMFERNALLYGLAGKVASLRMVNIPVLEIERDADRLLDRLVVESTRAISEDHADCIVLGCTGFLGVAERLEQKLHAAGHPVRVINPMPTTALIAAAFVHGGLAHSAAAYPSPNKEKTIIGFNIPAWRKK